MSIRKLFKKKKHHEPDSPTLSPDKLDKYPYEKLINEAYEDDEQKPSTSSSSQDTHSKKEIEDLVQFSDDDLLTFSDDECYSTEGNYDENEMYDSEFYDDDNYSTEGNYDENEQYDDDDELYDENNEQEIEHPPPLPPNTPAPAPPVLIEHDDEVTTKVYPGNGEPHL
jgi:hypothetical protein